MSRDNQQAASHPSGLRRVVTGHNSKGVGVVQQDAPIETVQFPGHDYARFGGLWRTGPIPAIDNNDSTDGAHRPKPENGIVVTGGTNLMYNDLGPGASAPMHRTSSVDHNILISGKLILIMEDGSETLFETPGDLVVQRGTMHAWKNPGPGWTRWVSVILAAEPAKVGGEPLADVMMSS